MKKLAVRQLAAYRRKKAVEIRFNEPPSLELSINNKMKGPAIHSLGETVSHGMGRATRIYACCRKAA
ncbi:hypothetical protein [Herbaspirillum sp.]|uniref:hypothetical protein n=1 Tax=Herbaspirillum sp. TaxID=1890675 RepID=UPI0031D6E029